jgi:hypothetical protein
MAIYVHSAMALSYLCCSAKARYMKRYAFILIVLGCTACQDTTVSRSTPFRRTNPEWTDLSMCSFWDTNYFFQCLRSQISNQPQWKPEEDYPPLPPRKAEAAALAQARLIRPDINEWRSLGIALRSSDSGLWYYVITLCAGDRLRTGRADYLEVPVLMNGETVQAFTETDKK